MIGGTHSGVGKTSVTLAIMAGLTKAGLRVGGYKVGPDYIDPSYHMVATTRASHNLDEWMMGKDACLWLFEKTSQGCDIAVIEGVMGLFDGISSMTDEGSSAAIAKLLKMPVILVVDAGKMARSTAAMIKGYQTLDPDIHICGVILNKVAGKSHLALLTEAVEAYNHIPVLGMIFKNENIMIPERHLGLKTASENEELHNCLKRLEDCCMNIDLDQIMIHAKTAQKDSFSVQEFNIIPAALPQEPIRIAYAYDRAFQFYYQANLDFLKDCGAELIAFSPLEDTTLPENIDGFYFCGGFPEVYAKEIKENQDMRTLIKQAIKEGIPTYAECGGLIYLAESVKSLDGQVCPMLGIIPGQIEMTKKLVNFGYCENQMLDDCFLGLKGEQFRGHEFHYSQWNGEGVAAIHRSVKKRRGQERDEGYCFNNVLASYVHCHFLSYSQRAKRFLAKAQDFQQLQQREGQVYD
ncbi:MAG: cobyrinate a,c-diamide synthase [Candidatus Scalindua sp.]|nr:cobyrinate a,c-diamide synthase [Planctomycetota bacterium]GJQ58479.1 MAG: cobyrinate a,c-diamide synthase [Candidatus Scalindua sp.]